MAQLYIGGDIVSQLILRSFAARSVAERKAIVERERPQPILSIKTKDRVFREEWYGRKDWLCGSEDINRFFCWPCLLFRPNVSLSWAKKGYGDLVHLLADSKKHERSKSHLEAYKAWRTFHEGERVDVMFSRARRDEVERHNEEVRQNREMLKTIIEAVLFLSKQELAFRGHDESSSSLNKGNYRELLECLSKFDSVFDRRLHGRLSDEERGHLGVFTGVSSDIQNDLIECIDGVIQDQINHEIDNCNFLSIQIDEATDISTKAQLSVIFRFDREGEIVERFLKFHDVSSDRCAATMSNIVKGILEGYGDSIKNKVIMQTYDGATVMSGHIAGVQALFRQEYPFAYFFHCAAHRLNLVLCQSASSISPVRVYFANVSAFSSFTSVSSKRKDLLRSHGFDIPAPGETRWYYRSRTISVIFNKYLSLIEVLEEITENPSSWDDATISQATGLLQYLNSFVFCFFTGLFNKILEQSAILYNVLQNRSTDFSVGVGHISSFENFLTFLRTEINYNELYESTVRLVGPPLSRSDKKHNYLQLYFEVLDNMCSMLRDRFQDLRDFEFLDLVNPKVFTAWNNNVPQDHLQLLKAKYGSLFDMPALQSQLLFMYKDADFFKENAMKLLDYIYSCNLQASLPEVVKLLKLNGAIAVSSASVERSYSCMRRVKSYLRSKMGQERLGSLCRISIHKDILKELEDKNQLHNLIIEKFVQKSRRLNFLYK